MTYTQLTTGMNPEFHKCHSCGAVVCDTEIHDDWHESLDAIAYEVYGIEPEDNYLGTSTVEVAPLIGRSPENPD